MRRRSVTRREAAAFVLATFDRLASSWARKGSPGDGGNPGIAHWFVVSVIVGDGGLVDQLEHWPLGRVRKLLAAFLALAPATDIAFAVKQARDERKWIEDFERHSLIEYLIDGPACWYLPWHDEAAG